MCCTIISGAAQLYSWLMAATPMAEVVAKKVIEHARRGERDPIRLREAVLKEVQSSVGEPKE
jgi:hypothetical protein